MQKNSTSFLVPTEEEVENLDINFLPTHLRVGTLEEPSSTMVLPLFLLRVGFGPEHNVLQSTIHPPVNWNTRRA